MIQLVLVVGVKLALYAQNPEIQYCSKEPSTELDILVIKFNYLVISGRKWTII